ncbi:mRNA export factor GLE1 [Heracleum sosnowskyi]|uniref:mRNA export factor GLE1 n=1 Tax=Heracleum sosnowskyi TaxID=360622 RepID=A0AAD8IBM4_9APIA|nr:mRNA export factor GLE1 [Heracleum sosnowskyi]
MCVENDDDDDKSANINTHTQIPIQTFLQSVSMGRTVVLELKCPKHVEGIAIDPQPDWSLDSLLFEINSIENKLNLSISSREIFPEKGFKRNPAFIMRVSDDEMEDEECSVDSSDVDSQALVAGTRFACDDDFSDSEDSEHELVLKGEPYLMDKVGLVEGALSELTHEHRLVVMEEVRNQISTLEADMVDKNEKFISAIARVEKHSEARREMEKKLDLQYQRTVAEDLDKYLTGVQRRHEHRSQIEERRIRDDAAVEEAKRRQEEKHRQEKIKAEAEMQARLEAEKKRAEEALESQRAGKEAAEKLVAENSKKAAALAVSPEAIAQTVSTRADGAEKAASSGTFLKAAESALKLEEKRSQIYKEVVAETEALRRNVDLHSHEMQIARRIRQISGTTESVRGKARELVTLITSSANPRSSTAMFAEKIVSQCVTPSGSFSKSVFAYAQVIVLVTSQVPQTMDILLAELNRVCIYTVPKYMSYSESIFKTKEAYHKAIGYQEENGKLENRDTYVERVRSCMKLYGALVQTEAEGFKNPHGIEEGWAWMARFLNALPANLYTAVSLQAFIEMAGFALYRRYRSQFKKILNIISRNFVSALKQRPDLANVVMNIQVYIDSSKFLEEPDGRRMQSSLLSSEAVPDSNHEGYHQNSTNRQQYNHQSYRQYY